MEKQAGKGQGKGSEKKERRAAERTGRARKGRERKGELREGGETQKERAKRQRGEAVCPKQGIEPGASEGQESRERRLSQRHKAQERRRSKPLEKD